MKRWIAIWMVLLCVISTPAHAEELQGDFMMIDGLTFDSDLEDFQERLGKGQIIEEEGVRGYEFNKVRLDGLNENAEVSIMLTSDNKPAWVLAETELPKFDFIGSVIYSPAGKVYQEMEQRYRRKRYAVYVFPSPFLMDLLSLCFDIRTNDFNRSASRRKQTEALTPKSIFPKFFSDLREFLFQQTTARAFICVDEFTELRSRLGPERNSISG